MARTKQNPDDLKFLSTLSDSQARMVLNSLIQNKPSLLSIAADIARSLVTGKEEDTVANEVCNSLMDLDVHQLWEESGSRYDGYVDPYEHSYEMMEEIIEPYLYEMDSYLDREMMDEALACCRGIMKGICEYMFEHAGEFADWAVDSEDGLTYDVIERWKDKNQNSEIVTELEAFRDKCLKDKG